MSGLAAAIAKIIKNTATSGAEAAEAGALLTNSWQVACARAGEPSLDWVVARLSGNKENVFVVFPLRAEGCVKWLDVARRCTATAGLLFLFVLSHFGMIQFLRATIFT